MMTFKKEYTAHLDTIVALVTNLAMTKWQSRTPTILAKELGLDHDEVADVLRNFKGLFRESYGKADYGEPYYWLQLRWARKHLEEAGKSDEDVGLKEPLEPEYLSALLNFVLTMVEQEQAGSRERRASCTATIAAIVAALAAIAAAIISYIHILVL